jgi:hypothetical protein
VLACEDLPGAQTRGSVGKGGVGDGRRTGAHPDAENTRIFSINKTFPTVVTMPRAIVAELPVVPQVYSVPHVYLTARRRSSVAGAVSTCPSSEPPPGVARLVAVGGVGLDSWAGCSSFRRRGLCVRARS